MDPDRPPHSGETTCRRQPTMCLPRLRHDPGPARLAGRKAVLVLDRGATGEGTSWAAAGMLSPLSEADDQDPFFQLCRASHDTYRKFIGELEDGTGIA